MRGLASIVVLAAVVVGGCGGEPTLSSGRADELHAQVAAAREAAGNGERAGALEALDGLEAQVRDLEAGGSLAEADADMLRRGIGRARRKVRAEVAEPTPEPTPAPTTTPEPTATAEPVPEADEDDDDGDGEAKGQGKGKGKAKGKDD